MTPAAKQQAQMNSLRHRVARALYEDGAQYVRPDYDDLGPEKKRPWLADADRVIPIILEACARVADQRNPEKPTEYLFPRERIGSAMKGLFVGMPSDDWECPIGDPECTRNCGSYGCGN